MPNKAIKFVPATKNVASTGLPTRCFGSRLWRSYTYFRVPHLIKTFVFSMLLMSCYRSYAIEIIGDVSDSVKQEIISAFNSGLPITHLDHVIKIYPKQTGAAVYKIEGKEGIFTIYHSRHEYGYKYLNAKYSCPDGECFLVFYNDFQVFY